ncbi:GTPase Era [Balneolales bacterium ANBcel1]|nr:GTPase Era [Balneolales bacterium ANBcel1]
MESTTPGHRSGFVGIIGRPNAGKSTLFNQLLGQKLSIITPKAQTTRHRIQGFYSDDDSQIVFLDTPGIIQPAYMLQERMMDQVLRLRTDADLLLHIVDGRDQPDPADVVYETLGQLKLPVMLVVNKSDLVSGERLAETTRAWAQGYDYVDEITISALEGTDVQRLVERVKTRMPEGPPFYPKDEASDLPLRFFVSELIREQLFMLYQQEIPYSCAVNVIEYREEDRMNRIHAEIVVNRSSQKGIVIGRKAERLKELGIRSRKEIEAFTGRKVHLQLFVKVREKWRDNENFLSSYGYR